MAKIIEFPTKLIPPKLVISVDESEVQNLVERLVRSTRSAALSHGFLAGTIVANITHIIIQYFIK